MRDNAFSAGDKASCSVTTRGVVAKADGYGFGRIAGPLCLEHADCVGDLLRHRWIKLVHATVSLALGEGVSSARNA